MYKRQDVDNDNGIDNDIYIDSENDTGSEINIKALIRYTALSYDRL